MKLDDNQCNFLASVIFLALVGALILALSVGWL